MKENILKAIHIIVEKKEEYSEILEFVVYFIIFWNEFTEEEKENINEMAIEFLNFHEETEVERTKQYTLANARQKNIS